MYLMMYLLKVLLLSGTNNLNFDRYARIIEQTLVEEGAYDNYLRLWHKQI